MGVNKFAPNSHFQLLTIHNPKLLKGIAAGYASFLLHLAPADLSGHEVCQWRTKECTALCLNTAGRGGLIARGKRTNNIQRARKRRTKLYFEDRERFLVLLVADIERGIRYARKRELIPCFRLNGTSDIVWESIYFGRGARHVFEHFPDIQFYDYTKAPYAARAHSIPNYHLTFSLAETVANRLNAQTWIDRGHNVAGIFRVKPKIYMGLPVFDGDQNDLRFLDPQRCVVGLSPKGRRAKQQLTDGFIIGADIKSA